MANKMTLKPDEYYKMLQDESYKALLRSEIQASAAKEQALKYGANPINQAGYGTQGLAESSRLGINNAYKQALQNASNQYENSMQNIAMQQMKDKQAQENDNFQSLTSLMSAASSKEQLDTILSNYGINAKDGILSGNGYDNLSDRDKMQLSSLYNIYTSGNEQGLAQNTYSDVDSLLNGSYISKLDGKAKQIGNDYEEEVKRMYEEAKYGNFKDNDVIALNNAYNNSIYLLFKNGTFQVLNGYDGEYNHLFNYDKKTKTIKKIK